MGDAARPMAGKVCLITGGTSGIGRATARALAEQGAAVILVARRELRGMEVARRIRLASRNEDVAFLPADLSQQTEIRRLAGEVRERCDRLDVLINNAGGIFFRRRETVDGLEMTFALNHLAYFCLTHLLMDLLVQSAPARVVNVTSEAHRGATLDLDDLENRHRYSGFGAYARSKLANLLFTYELAHRLEGTGVTANAVHPGFVRSGFGGSGQGLMGLVLRIVYLFGANPERGAETVTHLAASPEVEGISGEYWVKKEPVASSEESYDRDLARRLWEASAELTGIGDREGPRLGGADGPEVRLDPRA